LSKERLCNWVYIGGVSVGDKKTLVTYWKVISPKKRMVLARCVCGNERTIRRSFIENRQSRSCGCMMGSLNVKARITNGTGHGDGGTGKYRPRLYSIWASMLTRVRNRNADRADRYVNRGIKVCADWLKYENFKSWALQNNYSENLTLDRIDNDGNYEPKNCRFSTYFVQANNKTNTRFVSYLGEEICRITGMSYFYVRKKHDNGMTGEEIIKSIDMLK
jgi:hypothetical protein